MRAIYAPCNDTLEMPLVVSDSDIRFPEAFFFSLQLVFAMFSTGFVEKGWWQKKVYTFIEGKFISGVSSAYSCWLWFVCAFLVLPGGCRPWWIPVWQRNDICWCEGAFLLCNKICCVSPSAKVAKVIKAARSHFYYFYRTLHMVPSQMRCASFWKSKCYRHFPFMYTGLCAVEPSCLKPLGRCRPHRWDCTCRCILMCLHSYLCWFVVNQYKSSRIAASEVHLVCLHEWGPLIITTPWLQANFPQQLQLFTHGWLNFQWCRNYLLTLVPNGYHSGKVTKRKTLFHIYVCSQTHNSPVHQSSAS